MSESKITKNDLIDAVYKCAAGSAASVDFSKFKFEDIFNKMDTSSTHLNRTIKNAINIKTEINNDNAKKISKMILYSICINNLHQQNFIMILKKIILLLIIIVAHFLI